MEHLCCSHGYLCVSNRPAGGRPLVTSTTLSKINWDPLTPSPSSPAQISTLSSGPVTAQGGQTSICPHPASLPLQWTASPWPGEPSPAPRSLPQSPFPQPGTSPVDSPFTAAHPDPEPPAASSSLPPVSSLIPCIRPAGAPCTGPGGSSPYGHKKRLMNAHGLQKQRKRSVPAISFQAAERRAHT